MKISEEGLQKLIKVYKNDMKEYIYDNWSDDYVEKMSKKEAEFYLGHSVKEMTKEEIREEISETQKRYYLEGNASDQEILDMFLNMI